MEIAPFHNDLAEGPEAVQSFWRQTCDGVRLRVVFWPSTGARGTILLFTGRTEYAEKYGRTAVEWVDAGYSVLTIDWRGQGLSDRVTDDPRIGHVDGFDGYQLDAAELASVANELGCPKPWVMIAHSMGGCIGLRSLVDGFPVEKAVFSAPMWGINMPAWVRPLPYFLPQIMRLLGRGTQISPGTTIENYVQDTALDENMLTTDPDHYAYLLRHADAVPEFALGGPTLDWVGYAAQETRRLRAALRTGVPVLTFVGGDEDIVSVPAIRQMHADWPSGELRVIEGARHELMMETPALRGRFMSETFEFLKLSL